MSWLLVTPLLLLAVAVLMVPGVGLAYALGVRGPALALPAGVLSISMISVLAVVYAPLGIRWSLGSFAVGAIVLVVIAGVVRRLAGARWGAVSLRVEPLNLRGLLSGLGVWMVLTVYAAVRLHRNPSSVVQSTDNAFHMNAIQYALDTGQASSLTIGTLVSSGAPAAPYPAAWHAYVALILGFERSFVPRAEIGSAVTVATLAVIVCAWALGCLFLAQVLGARSVAAGLITSSLLGGLFLFPWAFPPQGGLYPNLLGNSLLPGLIALMFLVAGALSATDGTTGGRGAALARISGGRPVVVAVAVLALALPGVTLSHPNSAMVLALFALAFAWQVCVEWRRGEDEPRLRRHRRVALWGTVIASVVFVVMWAVVAPTPPVPYKVAGNLLSSTWGLLLGAVTGASSPAPALTALVLIGLWFAVRQRRVASLVTLAFSAGVYLTAIGGPSTSVAVLTGGIFYNDSRRVAAFALIGALPVVIEGVAALDRGVRALAVRLGRSESGRLAWRIGLVVLLTTAILVPLQVWSLRPRLDQNSKRLVVLSNTTRRINLDESKLIAKLPHLIPKGEKVIGEPAAGTAFIYGLTGVPVVFPHVLMTDSPATQQLRVYMFDREQLAATCAAMDELGAHYYYNTTRRIEIPNQASGYRSPLQLPDKSMLTVVAKSGPATLYRFTACDKR